jgi:hypothetical protein
MQFLLSAYFPYSEKKEKRFRAVCVSAYPHPINFRMPEPVSTKLGMFIVAPESILTTYFINPSHKSARCVSVYVAMQRLSKHVTVAKNTHATMEE